MSDHAVDPETGVLRVPLTGAPVRTIRVTVLATAGEPDHGVVAIREIGLPGIELGRSLSVPDAGATATTGFVFRAQPERRACVRTLLGPSCDADLARPGEEESGLSRTFRVDGSGEWTLSGSVTARAAPETAALLWPLGKQVRVGASSVLADDPAVSGQFAFDGDQATAWLSARGDLAPALVLRWDRPRTISRLRVLPATQPARAPVRAELDTGTETRQVDLGAGSLGFFAPLRTDHLTIRFPMTEGVGDAPPLPVGVGDLAIDGLRRLVYGPSRTARTGAPCGLGPDVVVDDRRIPTRVTGLLADVLDGTPLRLEPCGPPVRLSSGDHQVTVASTDRFAPTMLSLQPASRPTTAVTGTRPTEIRSWSATSRSVVVGAGPDALLRVPENVNAGWRATLDGRMLESTSVDGWQQAYRLPAGEGGLVRLTYVPDRPYRLALLAGAVAAILLGLSCAVASVRDRRRRDGAARAGAAGSFAAHLPAGWWGLPAVAVAWVVGGVPLLVGVAAGLVLRRRAALRRVLGVSLVALLGIAAAILAKIDPGASWTGLDLATGAAVGLLVASLLTPATADRQEED